MGENTNIDTLGLVIDLTAVEAIKELSNLSDALKELKKNSSFKSVSTNLNNLSKALEGLPNVYGASNSLRTLANSIVKLKEVGSVASLSNSLKKLPEALKSLEKINLASAEESIRGVVDAVSPLTQVKGGGFSSLVNSMAKLKTVTDSLDDSTIGKFAEKIKKLNEVVEPFATKMGTIKTALAGINTQAKSAAKSVENFDHGIETSTLNMSNFIDVARTAIDALQNIIQRMGEFIDQASQWDGISARFGRGFGEGAQETYEWVQRLNEEMSINIQQFMQYSSVYATMLTGFGVANKDATKMALGYAELTYDIWAGYNDIYRTFDEAAEAVRSAIAGEVEPVRRAGFTIIESTLQQTAANHGLEISIENATEAQKSYLRYLTLVDQAHAQGLVGTYAKEMNTAEGVMRTFAQQLKSLTQAFGSLFLPILVKVMPYVQAFVELLTEAVHWIASLVGIEIQKVDFSGYEVGSGAIDNVADSAGNATDSLGSAAKAAKELKNAMLGIDELNVISPSSSAAGGGIGGGSGAGGAGGGFAGLDIDSLWDESILDSVNNKVSAIKDKMKEWLGLTDDVDTWAELLDTRLGHILSLVGTIGTGIAAWKVTKQFMDSIDALKLLLANPKYAIAISAIVTIVGLTIAFDGMTDAIENGLDGFNFAETVGGSLLTAAGAAILGSKLATWISTAFAGSAVDLALTQAGINLGVGTIGAVGAALASAVVAIIAGIPMYFIGIYDAIVDRFDWLNGLLVSLGATAAGAGIGAIIGMLGGPIGAGIGALIGLAIGLVTDGILAVVDAFKNGLDAFNGTIITLLFGPFATAGIYIIQNWDSVVESVSSALKNATKSISEFFTNLWEPIQNFDWQKFGYDLGQKLGTAIKNAMDFVTKTIPDWLSSVWNNFLVSTETFFTVSLPKFVTETIPNAFNAAVEFMKGLPEMMWNAVVDGYNWFVSVGEAIIDGIWEGFTSVWQAIKDFVGGFVQGFKDALGIHSPSKVFAEIGKNIIDGLVGALNVNTIKDSLTKMWETAKTWWNSSKGTLSSYTPSIGSISTKLSSAWDSAKKWWKEKRGSLSTYTPSIGKIWEKLKSAWTTAKEWWGKHRSNLSYTPSIGSISSKLSSAWTSAKNWWKEKRSSLSYTPTIGSIKDKVISAWNSAKKWWSSNASLSTKLNISVPKLTVNWGEVSALGKTFKYPKSFSVKFAADGGIFDQGSLIWAGERGPEVMATAAGGKTGVMNVQQMQDAVYEGVYAAMSAAMRGAFGSGGEQAVNVYLDGRKVTASVEKHQRERGASIMGNEVYSY